MGILCLFWAGRKYPRFRTGLKLTSRRFMLIFSLGMPTKKVCERITKTNPEICSVKFPVQTEKMEKKDLSKLRVKQLKSILADRGVECKGCIEKEEFIKKVQDTEHLATEEF